MTRQDETTLFYLKNDCIKHRVLKSELNTLDDIIFWNNLAKIYLDAGLYAEAIFYLDMAHDALYAIR